MVTRDGTAGADAKTGGSSELARIRIDGAQLDGEIVIPQGSVGLVLFAHGGGSSRHSPRNVFVAQRLHTAGIATLLFDLLTPTEDAVYERRFDIELLTDRLLGATEWISAHQAARGLNLGYFGASTGAAAALRAAAQLGQRIHALVSRGGRPDLADRGALQSVGAPTLLIVGGRDEVVLELNKQATRSLRCIASLEIVAGATHLFVEPGALAEVAQHAVRWFLKYLPSEQEPQSAMRTGHARCA